MSEYAYWNQNTGQVVRSAEPRLRLERLDVWHPMDPAVRDEDAPAPVLDSVLRPGILPVIPPPPAAQSDPELPAKTARTKPVSKGAADAQD
ncbi:hypothetical protein [Kitasatospora sp. NPDC057738]|uniref:hypothetical protein n=1 Tax=Kitasatospora sp. NPDC057738 TaxID=3346233 RepID=UPI0036C0D841